MKTVIIFLIMTSWLYSSSTHNNNKYFIGASAGFTYISSDYIQHTGDFSQVTKADSSAYNLAIDLGYNYSKDYFSTFSASYTKFSDAKVYNYLLSINKRFETQYVNLYFGAIGGLSYLELTKSPIPNLPITDSLGQELALGVQAGIEKDLSDDFILFLQYQYLKALHTTSITSGAATAETTRDHFNSISLGIRWRFGNSSTDTNEVYDASDVKKELVPEVKVETVVEPKKVVVKPIVAKSTPVIPVVAIVKEKSVYANTAKPINLAIVFEPNKADIIGENIFKIETFIKFLKENLSYKAEIKAYTDSVGSEAANKIMSQKRAKSVYNYLINAGVSSDRLTYKGMGEKNPIASNLTKEGRAKNRRVSVNLSK